GPVAAAQPYPGELPADGGDQVATLENAAITLSGHDRSAVIERPGAFFVKVHVSAAALHPGDVLTVSTVDGRESYSYGGGLAGNPHVAPDESGDGFWMTSISGDRAVLTVHDAASRVSVD